jgi:hypothetical protein
MNSDPRVVGMYSLSKKHTTFISSNISLAIKDIYPKFSLPGRLNGA